MLVWLHHNRYLGYAEDPLSQLCFMRKADARMQNELLTRLTRLLLTDWLLRGVPGHLSPKDVSNIYMDVLAWLRIGGCAHDCI